MHRGHGSKQPDPQMGSAGSRSHWVDASSVTYNYVGQNYLSVGESGYLAVWRMLLRTDVIQTTVGVI